MKTVGVFDSGVGGQSVVNTIKKTLPEVKVIYQEDKQNVPYGTKSPQELYQLVLPILNKLSKKCDVIVVACNTVSTTLIEDLRRVIGVPLIAMEPMVKPAAELTKTKVIAVCATPTTLASDRYKWLKQNYAAGIKVVEPDCSDWASMIESNQLDHKKIASRIQSCLKQKADVIVLGCTHYHWIEEQIVSLAKNRAIVLQPEEPVIEQLKKVLLQQL